MVIPQGKTVVLDVSPPPLKSVQINGTLSFARQDLSLTSDWILVHGLLQIGTAAEPFQQRATIMLTGNNPDEDVMGMGTKMIGVMGGTVEMYGSPRVSWTHLNATAAIGSSQIVLERAVDWQADDWIVITSTDFNPYQANVIQVNSVAGNSVALKQPVQDLHWGELQTYDNKQLDERAEVGLLSRNIVIAGDDSSEQTGFGAHMMVMGGGQFHLDRVEFYRVGQKGRSGRYPLHAHLLGSAGANSFLKNSSIHHSYNRCVTLHGTNQVQITSNVTYNTFGHCFFLEDGVETGNVFEGNLGILTRRPEVNIIESDSFPSTYWISNPNNIFRNNVAAGSESFGFWYDLPEYPTGVSATNSYSPRTAPLGEFRGNIAHSNYGDWDSGTGLNVSHYNVSGTFTDVTAYKNARKGIWLGCCGNHTAVNARLANNLAGFFGENATLRDSLIVGKSANPDSSPGPNSVFTESAWNGGIIRGMEEYDGWLRAENVSFVNFDASQNTEPHQVGRAVAFYVNEGHSSSSRSSLSATSMLNAQPTWFPAVSDPAAEYRTFVVVDTDGLFASPSQPGTYSSGQPGAFVNAHPLLSTAACTVKPGSNAYWCPHQYGGFEVAPILGQAFGSMTFVRDDGVRGRIPGGYAPNGIGYSSSNILLNRTYTIQPDDPFATFTMGLNAPSSNWAVFKFAWPYSEVSVTNQLDGQPYSRYSSEAAFNAGTGLGYFLNATNQQLYVRLVGNGRESGGGRQAVVCNLASCPVL